MATNTKFKDGMFTQIFLEVRRKKAGAGVSNQCSNEIVLMK